MTALAALCGAGFGLGLTLVAFGLRRNEVALGLGRLATGTGTGKLSLRLAMAMAVGVLVAALTRWPVGALLAAGAGFALPTLIGGREAAQAAIARTEAIAGWAEMLRDTIAGAAGLEQAIAATAPVAPAPIRAEVAELAARLQAREPLPRALRAFADRLGDPTADLVVSALVLAAERQARNLGVLLGALATAARDQATMRLRVDAGRARTRTAVRVVTVTTLAMAAGLAVLSRGYLEPYDDALGQLVLAFVGLCFGGAFWWLSQMARVAAPERFLVGRSANTEPGP